MKREWNDPTIKPISSLADTERSPLLGVFCYVFPQSQAKPSHSEQGEHMKREWTDPTIEPITSLAEAAYSFYGAKDGGKPGSVKG